MKQFQPYLKYLDLCFYNEETESLEVRSLPGAEEALSFHEGIVQEFGLDREDRWILEMALCALKGLSQKDRDFLSLHPKASALSADLDLQIQRNCILPARQHAVLSPGAVSSAAVRYIFTILHPVYDYRNERLCRFFAESEFPALPADLETVWQKERDAAAAALAEGSLSSEKALALLRERLHLALGKDGFTGLLEKACRSMRTDPAFESFEDYAGLKKSLQDLRDLYPLETSQFIALADLGYADRVANLGYESMEACRQDILEGLGLQEAYAASMARALFLACHAARVGILDELPVSAFDLPFEAQSQLEDAGLRYIGDVRAFGTDRLGTFSFLTKEDLEKIRSRMDFWDSLLDMPI